jgi:hypothetical protein
VGQRFVQQERAALLPLPAGLFPSFQEARRCVHRDGYVEVHKAYYEAPPEYIGREVWVRWDGRVVRLFNDRLEQVAIHARMEPGRFSADPARPGRSRSVQRSEQSLLREARWMGLLCGQWAQAMLAERGPAGIRVLLGLLSLTRRYSSVQLEQACQQALSQGAFRLRDLRRLIAQPAQQAGFEFLEKHPLIRDLAEYQAVVQPQPNPNDREEIAL